MRGLAGNGFEGEGDWSPSGFGVAGFLDSCYSLSSGNIWRRSMKYIIGVVPVALLESSTGTRISSMSGAFGQAVGAASLCSMTRRSSPTTFTMCTRRRAINAKQSLVGNRDASKHARFRLEQTQTLDAALSNQVPKGVISFLASLSLSYLNRETCGRGSI